MISRISIYCTRYVIQLTIDTLALKKTIHNYGATGAVALQLHLLYQSPRRSYSSCASLLWWVRDLCGLATRHSTTLYHKWNTPTTRTRPSSCCQPVSALGSRTEDMANVKVWSQRNNLTLNCTSVATGNEVIGFGSNLHRRETEVPLSLCEILKNAFVRQGLFQGIFRGAQFQKLMYDVMH